MRDVRFHFTLDEMCISEPHDVHLVFCHVFGDVRQEISYVVVVVLTLWIETTSSGPSHDAQVASCGAFLWVHNELFPPVLCLEVCVFKEERY